MLRQFLAGGAVSLVNIAIHAAMTIVVISVGRSVTKKVRTAWPRTQLIVIMVVTVSILVLAHVAEVLVWAAFYALADVAPPGKSAIYFAFTNFSTLGYGDIIPSERWLLIGPMTSMNGALLFGWSTAIIFAIMRYTLVRLDVLTPD